MVEAFKEQNEERQHRDAWMIRWGLLAHGVKDPPSIEAILGIEKCVEIGVEKMVALLNDINTSGKWDA